MKKLILLGVFTSIIFASETVVSEIYKDSDIRVIVERQAEDTSKVNELTNQLSDSNARIEELSKQRIDALDKFSMVKRNLDEALEIVDEQSQGIMHVCPTVQREWYDNLYVPFIIGIMFDKFILRI